MMFRVDYNGGLEKKSVKEAFVKFMRQALGEDREVVYLDADLMSCTGMLDVRKEYPDRVLNCGIQECNMVGVAAGMSLMGMKPFIHSFAAFAVRRPFDQIFLSVAYADKSIHIIGSDPGVRQSFNGGTHMSFEDVALMQTVPHAHIFDITDTTNLLSVLRQTKDRKGVFYYRMPREEVEKVYSSDSEMEIGKGNILREGGDASVIACGLLVPAALAAAEILEKEGILIRVVDMFTIKPLDRELVIDCAKKTGTIVTAENASVYGGLGSVVADAVAQEYPVHVRHIGVKDEFGEVGPEDYLCRRFGFTPENIAKVVKEAVAIKLQEALTIK